MTENIILDHIKRHILDYCMIFFIVHYYVTNNFEKKVNFFNFFSTLSLHASRKSRIKVFFFSFLTSSIDWRWAAAWARDTSATFDLERNYNFWSKIEHSAAKSIFLLEIRTFCSEMIIFFCRKTNIRRFEDLFLSQLSDL